MKEWLQKLKAAILGFIAKIKGLFEKKEGEGQPPAPENGAPSPDSGQGPLLPSKAKAWLEKHKTTVWICAGLLLLPLLVLLLVPKEEPVKVSLDTVLPAIEEGTFSSTGTFTITGVSGYTESELREMLTLDPASTFTVDKTGEDTARIRVRSHHNVPYTVSLELPDSPLPYSVIINNTHLTVDMVNGASGLRIDDPIILTFSDPVDKERLSAALTISPRTDYELNVLDNTAVLTPYYSWEYGEAYQIVVNNWLTSVNNKRPAARQTLRFTTELSPYDDEELETDQEKEKPWVIFKKPESEMWREGERFALDFVTTKNVSDIPVVVNTYRMASLDKYLDQKNVLLAHPFDLSILEKTASDALLIKPGASTLTLDNPGPGGYIVEAIYEDPGTKAKVTQKTAFLVTDLTLYMQTAGGQTLLWLNQYGTGQPLSGYTATFYQMGEALASGVTDQDGVVTLHYSDGDDYYGYYGSSTSAIAITDPAGNTVYADYTNVLGGGGPGQRDRYYSYLFLDRTLYKPTDVISFWGYVKPYRNNLRELPETVRISFDEGGLDYYQDVEISSDGVYYGEIPLEAIKSSQYYISAKLLWETVQEEEDLDDPAPGEEDSGEEETLPDEEEEPETEEEREPEIVYATYHLDSAYVDVKEYQKPNYLISSTVDKVYYANGDQVTAIITPTFYDGTPLPNYTLEFSLYNNSSYSWSANQTITTNDQGVATVTFPAVQGTESLNSWRPKTNRYRVRIASDGEDVTHVGSYNYFPTDAIVTTAISLQEDGNAVLDVKMHSIDFDKVAALEEEVNNLQEMVIGEPMDSAVEISLSWTVYDRWRKRYYGSETLVLPVSEGSARLENLIGIGNDDIPEIWDHFYVSTDTAYSDSYGNKVWSYGYRYSSEQMAYGYLEEGDEIPEGYALLAFNEAGVNVLDQYRSYLSYDTVSFGTGESMTFRLSLDGEPVEESSGRLLYTLIQDEIVEQQIVGGNTLNLRQRVDFANNVNLVAAYFDGDEVHVVRNVVIRMDQESMTVNLEVTPDRESYRPGDTVRLQVRATDNRGAGVAGNVCVSVVDESVFALRDQYVYVLSSLYGDMSFSTYYIKRYTTATGDYTYNGAGGDGGKGGEDSLAFYDSFRSNFKDTALFLPTRTNGAGEATITFQLPDNTTSWRITALEVGDNLYAGQSKSNIISTLPFFMQPVLNSKYIQGDDIALLVQGHGTLLDVDDEIAYTVTVTGDGVSQTIEAEGVAYESQLINFGQLPMGEYTLTATARYSGYSDTVQLPFAVINSNLELVIHRQIDLTQPLDISAVRFPVVITVYDESNEAFYESISSLLGHYCMIANQRMSRFVAKRALADRMDPATVPYYIKEGNDSAADMQNEDGGIGWNVGGESLPELTTKVLLVAGDQFDHWSMRRYFENILSTTKDAKVEAACYLGLAAIEGEVRDEVRDLLMQEKIDLDVRAYLIAAIAYGGEREEALRLYEQQLSSQLTVSGKGKYVEGDEKATAAIWVAASRLGHDDGDAISIYFARNPWRIDTLFECMIYVTNYSKQVTPRTVSYTTLGETRTADLGISGQRSISFTKSEFESLRFQGVDPAIQAMAYYIGEPDEIDITPSDKMSVNKTVRPAKDGNYMITLELEFAEGAPTGQYDISDWIPSNTRLYKVEQPHGVTYKREEQKLYFTLNRSRNTDRRVVITYYVRQTYDAMAMVDTTYVIHGDSGENCSAPKFILGEGGKRWNLFKRA